VATAFDVKGSSTWNHRIRLAGQLLREGKPVQIEGDGTVVVLPERRLEAISRTAKTISRSEPYRSVSDSFLLAIRGQFKQSKDYLCNKQLGIASWLNPKRKPGTLSRSAAYWLAAQLYVEGVTMATRFAARDSLAYKRARQLEKEISESSSVFTDRDENRRLKGLCREWGLTALWTTAFQAAFQRVFVAEARRTGQTEARFDPWHPVLGLSFEIEFVKELDRLVG
jgi:hypothetical protein